MAENSFILLRHQGWSLSRTWMNHETVSRFSDSSPEPSQELEPQVILRDRINRIICDTISDPVIRQTLIKAELPWKYLALLMIEDLICDDPLAGKTPEETLACYCRELYRLYPEMFHSTPSTRSRKTEPKPDRKQEPPRPERERRTSRPADEPGRRGSRPQNRQ